MEFFTTDLDGITRMAPGPVERRAILASVEEAEGMDYPEVYLTSATGVVLGYRAGGILVWEEGGEVRMTMAGVAPNQAAEAWTLLAGGEWEALKALPWRIEGGTGDPP